MVTSVAEMLNSPPALLLPSCPPSTLGLLLVIVFCGEPPLLRTRFARA